jgi:hypothetical protein
MHLILIISYEWLCLLVALSSFSLRNLRKYYRFTKTADPLFMRKAFRVISYLLAQNYVLTAQTFMNDGKSLVGDTPSIIRWFSLLCVRALKRRSGFYEGKKSEDGFRRASGGCYAFLSRTDAKLRE